MCLTIKHQTVKSIELNGEIDESANLLSQLDTSTPFSQKWSDPAVIK